MPYFRITYTAAGGKSLTGIKEYHIRNIDDAFDYFLGKAKAAGFVTDFSCVMISTKTGWKQRKQGAGSYTLVN